MYDVVIIGAGVVGAMVARKLSAYQLKVCILEKENDVAMGASKANSAIVHAGFDAKEGSLKAKLNVQGNEMMPQIAKELGVPFKNNGSLVIGFSDADRKELEKLLERGKKNGVPGLRILEKDELKQREPNINDNAICALYAPTGAIICPYELTLAAIGNAMDNGVELKVNREVTAIRQNDTGFILSAGEDKIETRFIINAAGLYSDAIANMVGDDSFSVHPRRGEYLLLDKTCGSLVSHTIFRTPSEKGKGILVSPTVDNNLILGPTAVDITDKSNTETTQGGFDHIIKETLENVTSVPFNQVITSFCGLRAVGSTGDFIITTPVPGFINLAGIESPGLTSSPAIALLTFELLEKQGLSAAEKPDYNPIRESMHRFRESSIEEKNEWIQKDSAYGKIVCRCETVTEGEILQAIRTNPRPRDLDGVKRRTRAQMGRCQGGFCSPYIIELLAREQGCSYEDVTKSGGNSYINFSKTKEETSL